MVKRTRESREMRRVPNRFSNTRNRYDPYLGRLLDITFMEWDRNRRGEFNIFRQRAILRHLRSQVGDRSLQGMLYTRFLRNPERLSFDEMQEYLYYIGAGS